MATWNPGLTDYDSFFVSPFDSTGGQMTSEAYRHAFSGADMFAFIGNKYVGNLVGLTISVTREVLPLYTFGDPSPRTFVKGKRGIAGTMAFTQFNKHAVLEAVLGMDKLMKIGDLWGGGAGKVDTTITAKRYMSSIGPELASGTGNQESAEGMAVLAAKAVAARQIHYVDQLPPFDLTLTMVNEYGAFAWLALIGVQFVNEGIGYTLDNLASEVAVTYVARGVKALTDRKPSQDIAAMKNG